jgi:Flp pilus assembly protein TadG
MITLAIPITAAQSVRLREMEARLGLMTGSRGIRSTTSRHRGASIVELAFVAPVVFVLVLGIFEVGRGLLVIHLLNNAAQAGCRAGIVEGQSTANIRSVVTRTLTQGGINGEAATVLVNDGSTDAATAQAGDEITVKVRVPISAISWVPKAQFFSGSLQGQYPMRRD